MKVYVIVCNSHVSQEGYLKLDDAMNFILSRSDKPRMSKDSFYKFESKYNEYLIKIVNIKE